MTEELGAIGVAIRVGLGTLNQDLASIEKKIRPIAREHTISFKVGGVNVQAAQEEIRRITRGKLSVQVAVSLPANAGRLLHRELTSQMKSAGPVQVQIKANLSRTEVLRIKKEIELAMRRTGPAINVPIRTTGGGGSATTGGAAPAAAPRPTPPRSAPVAPQPAAAPTATAERPTATPARGRAASKGKTAREAHEEAVQTAPPPAAEPAPRKVPKARTKAATAAPGVDYSDTGEEERSPASIARSRAARARRASGIPNLGLTPTGPAVGVNYRTDAKGNVTTVQPKATGLAKRLQKTTDRRAGQTVSLNTLRDDKVHTNLPQTEDEIEYADRPPQVHLPLDPQQQYERERKGRGVKGASRSGARERNEPVLLPSDYDAMGIRHDDDEKINAGERDAALRAPARKSAAYYGGAVEHPGYARRVAGLQFGAYNGQMKSAYEALLAGNTDAAREHLRGLSGQLVTADPRKRKKFFKAIQDPEKAPPGMLEQHASLQALFFEVGKTEHAKRIEATKAELAAFPKPKGPKAGWPEDVADAHTGLQNAAQDADKRFREFLSGLKRREGGGPVFFNKAVIRDHLNEKKFHKVADTDEFQHALPGENMQGWYDRKTKITKDLLGDRKSHANMGADLWDVVQKGEDGYGVGHHPLYSPESRTGGVQHNPFGDTLDEVFGPMFRYRPDMPKRAAGGPVGGGLLARLEQARAAKNTYLVGEKKPELFRGESGRMEIVGEHGPEVRTFPEAGKIEPHVPEWVRRGMAKDLTHRAAGGPVQDGGAFLNFMHQGLGINSQFNPPTPPPAPLYRRPAPTEYEGRLAAEPGSGLRGRKQFREGFDGERAAIAQGKLGTSGGVQRVFVVNWPAGHGFGGGSIASNPAGVGQAASNRAGTRETTELARAVGLTLKDLLGQTEAVTPKDAAPETVRLGPLDPEELAVSRISARTEAGSAEHRLATVSHSVSEKEQLLPSRGAGPLFGQLAQSLFGGRSEAQTRAKETREAINAAKTATAAWRGEQTKLNAALIAQDKAETPEQRAAALESVEKLTKSTALYAKEKDRLLGKAEALDKEVLTNASAAQSAVSGLAGITVGTVAFGAILGTVQAGMSGIAAVMGPVIERMTGYRNTSAAVTSTLADQVRQQQGAVETTLAHTAATAGLSSATLELIGPALKQRSTTEAGNKALVEQIALLHASRAIQQQGGVEGVDKGITQTTGGLNILGAQTDIGGVPSFYEQLNNELRQFNAKTGESNRPSLSNFVNNTPQTPFGSVGALAAGGALGAVAFSPEHAKQTDKLAQDAFGAAIAFNPITGPANAALNLLGGGVGPFGPKDPESTGTPEEQAAQRKANQNFALAFTKDVADAAKRGGGELDIVANSSAELAGQQRAQIDLLRQSGIPAFKQFADTLEQGNLAIPKTFKNLEQLQTYLLEGGKAATKGGSIPDADLLIKQLTERIIPAQKNKFAAEGQFQRNFLNPAQFALGEIANPTPGIKGGPAFGAGTVGVDSLTGKSDQAAAKAAKSYESQVGGAVSYVNEQIDKGRQALINLVPANLQGEFRQVLGDIEKTGQQISSIQTGIQQKQVNLQVAEYNNQLRIAKRSLQDAKDLQAGLAGATRNTLGGIEGQNIAIQRQLQLLQFELQQRQINFRLATAGFVAPGTTPEERAARIEAAKQEAAFAQKQLDLQKQLANNEFKAVNITVDRNVTDLLAQISLLEQGRSVTIDVAAASRALDILNKKQQALLNQAGSYIEEGVKITQAAIDAATEVQRQTGKGFASILSQTANAWGIFGSQAAAILNALTGTAPARRDGSQPGQNDPKYASGIVGDTLGPTQITVGEAAGEKVAVLKNPKLVPSWSLSAGQGTGASGGGAQFNLTVIVTGNSIGKDSDAEELANKIATTVENRIMQKGSLFGLRRA